MSKTFWKDLAEGKKAEKRVQEVLENSIKWMVGCYGSEEELYSKSENAWWYNFDVECVSDEEHLEEYAHKGDLKLVNRYLPIIDFCVDVKNDKVMCRTGSIWCEAYSKRRDKITRGWMYSDYDYIAFHSEKEQKIYIVDFKMLKIVYRKIGQEKWTARDAGKQTKGYLCRISDLKAFRVIRIEIDYELVDGEYRGTFFQIYPPFEPKKEKKHENKQENNQD